MAKLSYSIGIQVAPGLQLSVSKPKDVQAYDRIQVTIDPGDAAAPEVEVDLQPGVAARVSLLLITSSIYGDELKYKISDGGGTDSPEVALQEPQLFLGPAVTLFGVGNPKLLKLKNTFPAADATKKAAVDVFVARNATA